MEVIIIRKLLSLFLVLVVVTSFSFTVFAAGEQPAGSSYHYPSTSGTQVSGTYWTAVSEGIYNMSTWFAPLRLTSYRYFDGTSTAGTNNFYSALTGSLYNIGANLRTNMNLLTSSSSSISSSASSIDSTLTSISTGKLPTTSGYSYDNNSGSVSNQTYWSATSNQLTFIFRKLGTIDSSISSVESKIKDYSTQLTSINSNTSAISTNTSSIDGKLPTGSFSSTNSDGTIDTTSNRTFWQAVNRTLSFMGYDVQHISNNSDSLLSQLGTNFSSVNYDGSIDSTTPRTFFAAANRSITYIANDIDQQRKMIVDLHTMFASPEDLALKADQENNISAATSNFLSGSDSATSVGTGSIGKVKDLGDDAAAWFDTGVQATSLFDALSNDDTDDGPWMWFTQATMDDLDSTSSNRSFKSSSSPGEYVPDLYGAKMDELNRMLNAFSD